MQSPTASSDEMTEMKHEIVDGPRKPLSEVLRRHGCSRAKQHPGLRGTSDTGVRGAFQVLIAICVFSGRAFAQSPAPRPNIVILLADDLGYSDVGCFGSEIQTPNIDSLAKHGVALTQFYNQARCCPTRAALMTGRYPHEVGIGDMIDAYAAGMRKAANSPAYQDHLSFDSPTMATLLRDAGYRTMMAGKWHLGKEPSQWPIHYGFDRSFVQINGAMNYYGGKSDDSAREPMALDDKPFVPPHDGFYTTDAFTDHAIEFVEQSHTLDPHKPFFLYLPYNAGHWPLQAPDADIAKYAHRYDAGWQPIREARLKKMTSLGIVPQGQQMCPMDRGMAKPWDELNDTQRTQWARRMEVYAAQIDHMDQQIGRVLAELKKLGVEQNTLVLWLSDNGGAAEDPNRPGNAEIGSRDSYRGYARPWATVSNTPWRFHKVTNYEGGISTPLIARWPDGIPADHVGTLVREPGHVMDLLPSFLELSGGTYPSKPGGPALEGQSIVPMLEGNHGDSNRTFFWEHEGNRGIRWGKWVLCSLPGPKHPFELYDIESDRIQSHNVAAEHPDVAKKMDEMYQAWAKRVGVFNAKPREGDGD